MLSYAGVCSLWIPLFAWMMPSHSFRVGMMYLRRKDWTFEVRLRTGGGGVGRVVCPDVGTRKQLAGHGAGLVAGPQRISAHTVMVVPLTEFARQYRRTTSLQDFVAASSLHQANGSTRCVLLQDMTFHHAMPDLLCQCSDVHRYVSLSNSLMPLLQPHTQTLGCCRRWHDGRPSLAARLWVYPSNSRWRAGSIQVGHQVTEGAMSGA